MKSFFRDMSAVTGLNIELFQSQADENGNYIGENGSYDPATNTLRVDINAGLNRAGEKKAYLYSMLNTAAHELTHVAKLSNKYETLREAIISALGTTETKFNELVEKKFDQLRKNKKYKNLSDEELMELADEEVICDSCETMLQGNTKFFENLYKKNKGLAKKFVEAIKNLVEKIKAFVTDKKYANTEYGKALLEVSEDIYNQVQQLWNEAVESGLEAANAQKAENKKAADMGGVKEQAREYGEGYNPIREKLAKQGLDSLSEKLGDRFPLSANFYSYITANDNEIVKTPVTANSVVKKRGEGSYKTAQKAFQKAYQGILTTVNISDLGIQAKLPQRMVAESINKAKSTNREQQVLDLIPHIKEILSNSILFNVERISHTNNKGTVLYGYRLYNAYSYKIGNTVEDRIVVSTIIQTTDDAIGYVFTDIENVTKSQGSPKTKSGISQSTFSNINTVAQLYKTVKGIDRKNGGLKYGTDTQNMQFYYTETEKGEKYSDRFTDTDRDYLSVVERGDMETAQKMVDEEAEKAGYTPKIMYHGSPNFFTTFDKKRARYSGYYGKGFYFSDTENQAKVYGNTYKVYLKTDNPLQFGKNDITRNQVKNYLSAIADNEDYDLYNYGTENIEKIVDMVYRNDALQVIQDINATAIGELGEAIELFNEVNGTNYDSVIVNTETVVYSPEQIKSADPVTYDDDGNVIPLSERFNTEEKDIRFQDRDYSVDPEEYGDLFDDLFTEDGDLSFGEEPDTRKAERVIDKMIEFDAESAANFLSYAANEIAQKMIDEETEKAMSLGYSYNICFFKEKEAAVKMKNSRRL